MIDVQGTFGRGGGITIKVRKYWAYQASANAKNSQKGHIKNGSKGHEKGQVEVLNTEEGKGNSQNHSLFHRDNMEDFDITKVDFDDE